MQPVPFHKPFLTGSELKFAAEALESGHLSGNGRFTKLCHEYFEGQLKAPRVLLTSSCTDALEMCSLLIGIVPGDEVIIPSYTFVSTANAFALRGARIRFADSLATSPNVSPESIRELINERTKAIVLVHYGGVACDMAPILALAREHNLFVIEDAAHAIDSYHHGKPLGTLGDLATYSFHETKNIQCGQGGLLIVNNPDLIERAEYAWEKGTDRSRFLRGEVSKYRWVSLGSSFLPPETTAAMLYSQILQLDSIQRRRCEIWDYYHKALACLPANVLTPHVPPYATRNGHLYFLCFPDSQEASAFAKFMSSQGISVVTHYLSLHSSPYFADKHDGSELPYADYYTAGLIRLPLFSAMTEDQCERVVTQVHAFFGQRD